jgi:hypothetical protein
MKNKKTTQPAKPSKSLPVVLGKSTKRDQMEFARLDRTVKEGIESFVTTGEALAVIHAKKLWLAGGFSSWEEYCHSVYFKSKTHAHRLIRASQVVIEFRENPEIQILPVSESQVRPLLRLALEKEREFAWNGAVCQATTESKNSKNNYIQPTAALVEKMVQSVLNNGIDFDKEPTTKPVTKKKNRKELVAQMRNLLKKRNSWDELEQLFQEFEKLI